MPATTETDIKTLVSATLLKLRLSQSTVFFATLALFAKTIITASLPTAATDGKDIYINPAFFRELPPEQRLGLIIHEVLHAALLHVTRRQTRDPLLWNIACDIVVNGMITPLPNVALPDGAIIDKTLEALSVEEVYDKLLSSAKPCRLAGPGEGKGDGQNQGGYTLTMPDLDGPPGDAAGEEGEGESRMAPSDLDTHWRHAVEQAKILQTRSQGTLPAGMERELGALSPAQLDWRSYLWRFLVRTPTDFTGFDRRFLGRGLYLDALDGEKVTVSVCVDTSGSIDHAQIRLLLSEVEGILHAYPHLSCALYYADAAAYGPYDLDPQSDIPDPQGGGGTDFRPFFEAVEEEAHAQGQDLPTVAVYLTDGYGSFPDAPPDYPVLWVLTPGGLDLDQIPFGESARLLRDR